MIFLKYFIDADDRRNVDLYDEEKY